MRKALPNAAFIGFTGTPLIKGEDSRTREVFGDYVSIYDFRPVGADGATVPLYYEARKPELQLDKDALQEELDDLLDEAMLDEAQEAKLNREFARQYTLITNPDRLDKVAEDVALHFAQRGYRGKAMFVAIDKATAVAMYDRVKAAVARLIAADEAKLKTAHEAEGAAIAERLHGCANSTWRWWSARARTRSTTCARRAGHRAPPQADADRGHRGQVQGCQGPLRLVFVCAMWITGFDVPSIGTVYLDKPMKNHADADHRPRQPQGGGEDLGRDRGLCGGLQQPAEGAGGLCWRGQRRGGEEGKKPIEDKAALVEALNIALNAAHVCLGAQGGHAGDAGG
jgi:type I restriction enzyme R subunit